ncbi:hypothetical protein ABT186_14830 [Streptomyces sp. NPDC001634]|uniref:hypothetical protein n=1 Tax=Streptomyces sp. NPDC001634 TaxID=3154390 RepID=UPI003333BF73
MKSKLVGRIGMVAVAAVSATVVATSPAAAITYGYGPWYDGTKGAVAYFEKHGDHIKVCDIKSDGDYAWVYVYDETKKEFRYSLTDTKNDGKCHYASAADGGWYDLPEKHWFMITVHNGNWDSKAKSFEIYNNE